MENIILILLVGILMVLAFLIGARTSQKAYRGEEIKIPNINPIKAVEGYKEHIETTKQQKQLDIELKNIDNYSGDELGQKDIK